MDIRNLKPTKETLILAVGMGCTVVSSLIKSYNQKQQAQIIADIVVKQMKQMK